MKRKGERSRLADQGGRFEQLYVYSPICSPSRVAISTGPYLQRWKITSDLAFREVGEQPGVANWLDPQASMLARSLQNAGCATGHMRGQRDVDCTAAISEYGLDLSLAYFEGIGPNFFPLPLTPRWEKTNRIWHIAKELGGESMDIADAYPNLENSMSRWLVEWHEPMPIENGSIYRLPPNNEN